MHEYNVLEKGISREQAVHAMILLHGRGGSARDIITLADEFCDDTFYIAAPQATNNTWYPYGFMAPEVQNEPWLSSAIEMIKHLVDETRQFVPAEHIYIMGFSQGACLALEVAARHADHYGGVVAFTGGLIGSTIQVNKYHGDFQRSKVFIGNSDKDPHVPVQRSQDSMQILEDLNADVLFKIYQNMGHTIIEKEIHAVKEFMF